MDFTGIDNYKVEFETDSLAGTTTARVLAQDGVTLIGEVTAESTKIEAVMRSLLAFTRAETATVLNKRKWRNTYRVLENKGEAKFKL